MSTGYRPEIDGLRALAVVPVMMFHGGVTGFGGGYAGVDVFFVISGYLITSILLAERAEGRFSIIGFYERRARRILPALFLVMLCTIAFAWMWMPDRQLKEYGDSLVATSLFMSNLLFWLESGYFAAAAEEKPLLHTWSLAIEEQFYLFFPLLLALVWRFRKDWLLPVTLLCAAASLAFALYPSSFEQQTLFYLIPARAWELLAGAALAMMLGKSAMRDRLTPSQNGLLALLGLGLIVLSMAVIDRTTPFPGPFTILPVLGTVLIITFADNSNWVGRVLSSPIFVGIGLVSYSAYLWHQPLFAFARLRSLERPSELLMVGLSLVALALAYLSWRFVERPFRDRRWLSQRQIFASSFAAAATLVIAGSSIGPLNLASNRLSAEERIAVAPASSKGERCKWKQISAEFEELVACEFGAAANTPNPVILWGESHAAALLDVMDKELKPRNIHGVYVRNLACRNIPGTYLQNETKPDKIERCEAAQAALLDHLRSLRPRSVLVAMRWTLRLYPVDGAGNTVGFVNGEGGEEDMGIRAYVARDKRGNYVLDGEAKFAALRAFLLGLKGIGAPVAVLYPVPEVGWHIGNFNFKRLIAEGRIPEEISTDFSHYLVRNQFILGALGKLVPELGLRSVDPAMLFCNTSRPGRCMAQEKGVPLYFDDDHVSETGARMLIAKLLPELGITR